MKRLLFVITLLFPVLIFAQFSETKFIHGEFPHSLTDIKQGDIDNDGLVDMVFAFDGNISWSKNIDGNGLWSTNQPIDMEYEDGRQIQVVDIDGDNLLDIVVIHDGDFETWVKWYKNESDGQFSNAILIDEVEDGLSGPRELSIASEDLDNDGDLDIAAAFAMADEDLDVVLWYRNEDGQGDFSDGIEITTAVNQPWYIQIIKANNDNFFDVLVSAEGDSLILHENMNGTGFSLSTTIATTSIELLTMTTGDVDSDGDMDIVAGTKATEKIVWYENLDNTGSFADEALVYEGAYNPEAILVEDVDGDLDLDIIYYASFAGELGFMENLDGMANFGVPTIFYTDIDFSYTPSLAVLDMDNDMDLDLVSSGDSPRDYYIFSNSDGEGDFVMDQRLNMSPPSQNGEMRMADIDGDNHADVVIKSETPYLLSWLRYNPVLELYEKPINIDLPTTNPMSKMLVFDVNNDGYNDIIFNTSVVYEIFWLLNDGSGNFSIGGSFANPGIGALKFYSADLNNDNYEDLIFSGGGAGLYWFENLGATGGFAPHEFIYSADGVDFVEIADYDSDGFLDLIPILANNTDIGWIKNDQGTFLPWESLIESSFEIREILMHDLNDDGLKDFFVLRSSGSVGIKYFEAIAEGTYGSPISLATGFDLSRLNLLDYDFDGLNDLVFVEDGEFVYWQKNTNDANLFDDKELIDLGLVVYSRFYIQDIDSDGDRDFVFGDNANTYSKSNIASNGKIIAKAFYDLNSDGVFDTGEPLLNNFQFFLDPNQTLYFTANDSASQFFVPEGNYTLNSVPLSGWSLTGGSPSIPIEFTQDTIIEKRFGYFPSVLIESLSPDLTSAPTRCGFTVPFWLTYTNDGTTIANGLVELYIDDYATFLNANPSPDSISNDTLYWMVDSLPPTHLKIIDLKFEIFDVNFIGDTVRITTNAYTLNSNNEFEFSQAYSFGSEINCSYDPNDKLVRPAGFLDENYTLFGEELEFIIRFQNTGTDTAFNIIIQDFLDSDLDWTSFRIVSSSHSMETTLNPQTGLVNFIFPNILLPDSTANELLSHGFVKYKIKPNDNLAESTPIENTASIFFDFNPPIYTNTTLNTFVSAYPIDVVSVVIHPLCAGSATGSIELDVVAIDPIIYEWNDTTLNGDINENLLAGTYEITITDGVGGTLVQSFILTDPPALSADLTMTPQSQITLGSATITPAGGTLPYMIQWNTNPIQTGNTAIDLVAGIYSVILTDNNGCIHSDSIEVPFVTVIKDVTQKFSFDIIPNPTDGDFIISFGSKINSDLQIEISDVSGRKIYEENFANHPRQIHFNLDALNIFEGLYFIGINYKNKTYFKKLLIIK